MESIRAPSKILRLWTFLKRPLINSFIVFYVLTSAVYLSPPSRVRQFLLAPFWNFIEYVGLWQYYSVFAPPRQFNLYLDASVKLENGETFIYKYPRIEQLGLFEKMHKERFRKLYNDIANYPSDSVLWPDLARYIARQVYAQRGVRPLEVTLIRHWSDIPPPVGDPLPPLTLKYNAHGFVTFPVKAEDLQ